MEAAMEGSRYDHPYYGRPGSVAQPGQLFSADFKKKRGTASGLAILAIQIGVPLITACLARSGSSPNRNIVIYVMGFLIAAGAYLVCSNLMPVRGYGSLKGQFAARMLAQGIDVDRLEGIWVGFSPDGEPRIYSNNYDWDVGFLLVMPDRLCFLGEQAQFALQKDQVAKIRLGPGGPSWWGLRRVYVDCPDDHGAIRSLILRPADARSMRGIAPLAKRLLDRLLRWRVAPSDESAISSRLAALGSPDIAQVPSQSVAQITSYGRLLFLCFNLLLIAAMASFMARLPFIPAAGGQALYVLAVVFVLWLLQALTYIARLGAKA